MNPTSIYSKTGKGVQEASGKTSQLSRGDRAILSAIDGKTNLKELSAKFDRAPDDKFFSLIRKLDADGFIREVSPGMAERGAARVSKPAPPSVPAAAPKSAGEDLDFTQIFSAPPKMEKPPAPAGGDPMAAARQEAELRARAEREAKARAEAAAKANIDSTQKFRIDAEARAKAAREASMHAAAEGMTKAQIEARTRAEADGKARAAAEAQARAEAAVRAKVEAERLAQERAEREAREAKDRAARELRERAESAERARFEAADRARREAEELRFKLEEERHAREEAERRARDEAERTKREAAERARREAEEKKVREEAEALRAKLDEERSAREEAERKAEAEREKRRALDEAERKLHEAEERREAEEHQRQIRLAREAEDKKRRDADARKKKEEEARRWEHEDARRKSDDAYRQRAEQEDKERAEREVVEAVERAEAEKKAAEAADALAGSLMADLDSFSKREEDERKEQQEQEKKEREERLRKIQEEEARHESEEAERKARKAEEKRQREEEERKQKEEDERVAREAEAKWQEVEEKRKKERDEKARKKDDIPISSSDLGRDDISDDERKLTPEARKALRDREREVQRLRARGDVPSAKAATAYKRKQPVKWGKPVAIGLFFLLVVGVGALNVLPQATAEYERLASDALGTPVKIGSARMWVLAGVEMRFERVQVGESIRIAEVRAVPEFGALLSGNKAFSRVEIDKLVLSQDLLGGALFGVMKSDRLRVSRVVAKGLKLEGPLALPAVDADVQIGSDGHVFSVRLTGEGTNGQLTLRGDGLAFEVALASFTLPFLDKLAITDFGMKGSANRQGMTLNEFDGRLYDGTVVGKARIQWGTQWSVQGEIQGRTMNAAVFAPQLVSQGRFDGKGRFALAAPDPAKLGEGARLDGTFTVTKGALGTFDLSRALQSTSGQASGRTPFSELEGSVTLANGSLALRDLRLASGILSATGSLDVDPSGGLSGRINAELRNLHGTYYIGGKLQDPQLRR